MLNKNHRYKILQDFISHQRHRKLNKVTQLTRSYEVNLKDIENCQSDIKRPPGWQRFFFFISVDSIIPVSIAKTVVLLLECIQIQRVRVWIQKDAGFKSFVRMTLQKNIR